jgi:prevent-host-death family protein
MAGNSSGSGRAQQEKYEHIWMRGYVDSMQPPHLTPVRAMCNMCHMKTISLRELHNNTGKWIRCVAEVEEIIVTDRGVEIAVVRPMKKNWANRPLRPGYAAAMKAGRLKSSIDSSIGISEDRTSRDNSVAGIEE